MYKISKAILLSDFFITYISKLLIKSVIGLKGMTILHYN